MIPLEWSKADVDGRGGLSVLIEWRIVPSVAERGDEMGRVASFFAQRFASAVAYCSPTERRGIAVAVFESDAQLAEATLALWRITGEAPSITPVVDARQLQALHRAEA